MYIFVKPQKNENKKKMMIMEEIVYWQGYNIGWFRKKIEFWTKTIGEGGILKITFDVCIWKKEINKRQFVW